MAVTARPPVLGGNKNRVLNGGNPLANGIAFCCLPGTDPTVPDLVSNRVGTHVDNGGSPLFLIDQRYGQCIQYSAGTGDGYKFGSYFAVPSGSSTYTLGLLAKPPSVATRTLSLFQGDAVAGGNPQLELSMNSDSGASPSAGLFSFYDYNSGFNSQATSTAGAIDGNWHVFVGRRNGTGSTSGTVWVDGVNVTNSQSGGGGTLSTLPYVFICGSNDPGLVSCGYPIALGVMWNRSLTDDEIYRWSADPFQIIAQVPTLTY